MGLPISLPANLRALVSRWTNIPAERLRAQYEFVSKSYPQTFAVGLIVVGLLTFSLHGVRNFQAVLFTAGLHAAIGALVLVRWKRQRTRDSTAQSPLSLIVGATVEAALIAAGWFAFLSTAGIDAPPQQQTLISTIMAGVMAVGALRYAVFPAASLAFMGSAVLVASIYSFASAIPATVFIFMGVFVLLLARTVLAHAHMFTRQFEIGAALAEGAAERAVLDALAQRERWKAEAAEAQAATRVREGSHRARAEALAHIAAQFEQTVLETVTELATTAEQASAAAEALGDTSVKTQTGAATVASRAGAADVGAISLLSACEQLNLSARQVKMRISAQERVSGEVRSLAEEAGGRLEALVACAAGVENIVHSIGGIAEQTNLLALNATIEAARAGESGRGFTVVAQEVKALAAQTSAATDEVRQQIKSISDAVEATTLLIHNMLERFGTLGETDQALAQAFEGQGEVIELIRQHADVAASLTTELQSSAADAEEGAQHVAGLTGELGSVAQHLVRRSQSLTEQTSLFLEGLKEARHDMARQRLVVTPAALN